MVNFEVNQEESSTKTKNGGDAHLESPRRKLTRKLTSYFYANPLGVLPRIENTPILLIRFTTKASSRLIQLVKGRLQERHIIVVVEEKDSEGNVIIGITTTQEELEAEADHLNLIKPATLKGLNTSLSMFEGTTIMQPFEVSDRDAFEVPEKDQDDNTVYDQSCIFTSADRVKIVHELIESLSVLKPGVESSYLARSLNELLKFPQKDVAIKYHKLFLFDTLRNHGLVEDIAPIHSNQQKAHICHEVFRLKLSTPVHAIRDYYGEEVAFYFAWMTFYIKALMFPAMSGLIVFIIRAIRGDTIDTDIFTPFHGLVTFIWAILFVQFWSREEQRLAYKWGTWSSQAGKGTFSVRHQFEGTMRISEVTKTMEKHYPPNKRRLKCLVSALVTLVLLAGAFFVMILSLNMQGYIKHKHTSSSKNLFSNDEEDCHHPFYFEFFASLSEEGSIFDAKSTIQSTLAVVLHVALVLTMNMLYRKLAEFLTDWENHQYQVTHNNSLIMKRFCFEAFDAYLVLMYLAFYEQDVTKVRSELINVFNVDTFRRLLLEGFIPYVRTKLRLRTKWGSSRDVKKNDDLKNDNSTSLLEEEANKDEYEEFDDYIEMIIQLGYITLFASAYPLAPFVAILANCVELRLDAFKITHVHKRPWAVPLANIGVWATLIRCIVWLSAITNCMIFCFSSMQMMQYLPDFFTVDKAGEHDLKDGNGWVVIFIIFGIERLLLVIGIVIGFLIPDFPEDVRIKEQQKEYVLKRIHNVSRSQKDQ